MGTQLPISLACGPYDRTRALMTGEVPVEGCRVNYISLSPEEVFFRAFGHAEFDVAELSFSTYLIQTAKGECEYVGIPAFVSRLFRHSAFYVRTDRISSPQALRGARVGVPEYQVTAAVWARGILKDEYGVRPSEIDWVTGGVEEGGRTEKVKIELPADIRIRHCDGPPLGQLLAEGELDAILAPRPPSVFRNGAPNIGRLFPDYRSAEAAYFKKTGIFPIMHIVGVRKSLAEQNPWLPGSLMKAMETSRLRCLDALSDPTAVQIMLPWLVAETEVTRKIMGEDYWSYGVEKNRKTIETLLQYHHDQGLSHRLLSIEEIFHPGSLIRFRI